MDLGIKDLKKELKELPGWPWQITGDDKHWKDNYAYLKIRGTQPGDRYPIADVRYLDYSGGRTDFNEAERIAKFLVKAPEVIDKLIRKIETLEGNRREKK